jgi:hypothetical protein
MPAIRVKHAAGRLASIAQLAAVFDECVGPAQLEASTRNNYHASWRLVAIQASILIFLYNVTPRTFILYMISYTISYLIYVTLISCPISGLMSYMTFGTGPIGSTLG